MKTEEIGFISEASGGSSNENTALASFAEAGTPVNLTTLAALPTGARLILRCRADWRVATISEINLERITLSVGSPSGRTYRVRKAPETIVALDGSIPILGEGTWRACFARYDARW